MTSTLAPWASRPAPGVRLPGIGGVALALTAVASPDGLDAGVGIMGVGIMGVGIMGIDIRIMTPDYEALYRRRPVEAGFSDSLKSFLWSVASSWTPEELQPFHDPVSGLSIRVLDSSTLTVTLKTVVIASEDDDDTTVDTVTFETSRAALITASQQAEALALRGSSDGTLEPAEPLLPLDLFSQTSGYRLTGIYRTGRLASGAPDALCVTHFVRYAETAHGDIESSVISSLLPFCFLAAHGVDDHGNPWVVIIQILPVQAHATIAAPWDALQVAREEIQHAIQGLDEATIVRESTATHEQLVSLLAGRGLDRSLLDGWTMEDLVLAGVVELANAPLPQVVAGRLTGCAFPDVEHDCPKDVFACAFERWQEMLFNQETEH